MKKIELTQGQYALVDDWNYDYLIQWKWRAVQSGGLYYAVRGEKILIIQKRIWMARVIANTPNNMECDHINHNTLDNQEHNLRNVTHSQNMMNKRVQSNNTLGEKGITFYNYNGYKSYIVQVHKDGKCVYRKTFKTLEDAKQARNQAIEKYHREFSYY